MNRVDALLRDLAQQLGVTVEGIWPHLVRYELASAVSSLLIMGFFALLAIVLSTVAVRIHKSVEWENPTVKGVFVMFTAIFVLVTSIWIPVALAINIPTIIEPEGATVMKFLERLQ